MSQRGTIARVMIGKGYGFIRTPGAPDVFFHISTLCDELIFDEQLVELEVEFDVVKTDRGARADSVRRVRTA